MERKTKDKLNKYLDELRRDVGRTDMPKDWKERINVTLATLREEINAG